MKNILVALDFSGVSDKVLKQATVISKALGAKLWLVHIAAPDPEFIGYEAGPQTVRDYRAKELRAEHRALQNRAAALTEEGLEAEALLIQGPTVDTLLEKAGDLQSEMIIIGAHTHGWLFEKLVGSTWNEVVRRATVPILIVPDKNH